MSRRILDSDGVVVKAGGRRMKFIARQSKSVHMPSHGTNVDSIPTVTQLAAKPLERSRLRAHSIHPLPQLSGRSSVRSECRTWNAEVARSNRAAQTRYRRQP